MNNNRLLLITLTLGTLLVLQLLHVFTGVVIWNLDHYVGGTEMVALAALGIISLLFLAIPLEKFAGPRRLFLVSFTIIALSRILVQLFTDPLVRIVAASAGVIAWLWFLVSWSGRQAAGSRASLLAGASLAAGSVADLVIRTWLLGYDMPWRRSTVITVISVAMSLLLLLLVLAAYKKLTEEELKRKEGSPARLFLLGPWLFLAMALFQNPPAVAGITGGSDLQAGIVSILAAALFLLPAVWLMGSRGPLARYGNLAGAMIIFYAVAMINVSTDPSLLLPLAGGCAHMLLISFIFAPPRKQGESSGIGRTAAILFGMFLVVIILIFLYGEFKLREVTVTAALFFLPAVLLSFYRDRKSEAEKVLDEKAGLPVATAVALAALVAMAFLPLNYKSPAAPGKMPEKLTIMTYNIHQAFDAEYVVDLERISRAIKKHNADIVCLQEVNRGQVVTGMIDSLALIREDLNYFTAFGSNHADGQYGNAILSRWPLKSYKNHTFENNIYEVRGILEAEITWQGKPLTIMVTHLDFLPDGTVRGRQVKEVLHHWNRRPRTIICGDFNAEPESRELKAMYTSGLKEASREKGLEKRYTFHESRDEKPAHIDYHYYTDDIIMEDFIIDETRASDHMPLVMTFRIKKD